MGKAKSARPTLADTIRRAVDATGLSVYAVAKASGISQPIVHRFMNGERGLTLDTADKLCRFLGLRLTATKDEPDEPSTCT